MLPGASMPWPKTAYKARMTMAGGMVMKALTLNLSLSLHPCVDVAAIVVSR